PARIQGAASPFMMTGVSSVIEYSLYTYRLNNSQKFSPSPREYQYDLFRSSYSSLLGCFLFQPSCTTPSLTSRVDRVEFCCWTCSPSTSKTNASPSFGCFVLSSPLLGSIVTTSCLIFSSLIA